jgi:hypothetical protein
MVSKHPTHGEPEEWVERLADLFRTRGIYYIARIIVLLIFASLLFFPQELDIALKDPTLLALLIIGPLVLAITLLADLMIAQQRTVSSLVFKYFFLTLSIILLYGLFFYVNATLLQPPGIHHAALSVKSDGTSEYNSSLGMDSFYLSATTYFTIGYGDVVPVGTYARTASVFEAFTGGIINLIVLALAFQRLTNRESNGTLSRR